MPAQLKPLATQLREHPTYRKTYDILSSEFGMVKLDKLVVAQRSVTWNFVDTIKARLGAKPSDEELFRFSLPLESRDLPVQGHAIGSLRFMFRSVSKTFRFHEAALLRPDQLSG